MSQHESRLVTSWFGVGMLGFVALLCVGVPAFSQAPSSWSGQAQCQLKMEGSEYVDREVQTWTITGALTSAPGAMPIYSGTWTVNGKGTAQRTVGPHLVAAQWITKVPETSAPIAIFVRASDRRLVVKLWHSQLHVPGAIAGTREQSTAGATPTLSTMGNEAQEWPFPVIEDAPASSYISGSGTIVVPSALLPMQPPGVNGSATCTWQFRQGAASQPAPANNMEARSSSGSIPTINNGLSAPSVTSTSGQPAGGAPGAGTPSASSGGTGAAGGSAGSNAPGSASGGGPGMSMPNASTAGAAAPGIPAGSSSSSAAGGAAPATLALPPGKSSRAGHVASVPCPAATTLPWSAVILPNCGVQGRRNLAVTVTANISWNAETLSVDSQPGITVTKILAYANTATIYLDIDAGAAVGPRTITLKQSNGPPSSAVKEFSLSNAFTILPATPQLPTTPSPQSP
jgi:hypothetical protein